MGKNKALESSDSYTVGWIAALPKEMAATLGMLDERHDKPKDFVKPSSDTNAYCWGRIGDHNVVIASLAAGVYGTTSAATTAIHMLSSFPSIKVGLMVGIGAAIPGPKHDIRLGDVVVSQPHGQAGGVIQYDLGKSRVRTEHEHTVHTFEKVGVLRPPPEALLKALSLLQAEIRLEGSSIFQFLEEMLERYPRLAQRGPEAPGYIYQGQENDKLFEASYLHTSGVGCDDCDPARMVSRDTRRDPDVPRVHYGVIASGNRLVKDAAERDMILRESGEDCICLETEAAGLLNSFPCLVIRGICDYADSHGNNDWQEYAAATAAAYAKEFLGFLDQGDLARASKASEVLEQISEDLKKMNKTVKIAEEAVQDLQLDYHEKKIGDWLSAPDPSTNYINALEKRHQDTGLWFTRGEVFARWNRQPGSFLWLHGIPGCGKTILSSTIIEHLRCYNKPDQPLLYFYFDFSDSKKQTLENMLRSLTNQLYQGQPEARSPLDQLWESHGYGNQQLSKQSLRTVLPAMLSRVNDPSIVIDALDEASTRSNLLAWLEGICGPGSPVRVLVITRSEEDIERAFEHWTQPEDRIGISESDIDGDIRVYVNHTVRNGSVLDRWQGRPDVQDEIESELVVKANGMFRWVACQLDALKDCLDYPRLRHALENLPRTLEETYTRILERIPRERMNQATTILNLLIWSKDLLTLDELVDAVAVDLNHEPGFDPKNRMPVPREVLELCSSLVTMSRREYDSVYVVRLAHFSVQEYLVSNHVSRVYRSSIGEKVARAYLAKLCLTYLIGVSQILSVSTKGTFLNRKSVCSKFPFARYSGRYWMDHARGIETKDESLRGLVTSFFMDKPEALFLATLTTRSWWGPKKLRTANPISYASCGGLTQVVEDLIDKGAKFTEAGDSAAYGYLEEALRLASREGHDTTVQLLLDRGADINAGHGNALRWASLNSNATVVQLLLDRGADANAGHGNALRWASLNGDDKTVQLLLDRGADIDVRGEDQETALTKALNGDHYTTVQLLLENNAFLSLDDFIDALRGDTQRGERLVSIMLPYVTADLAAQEDRKGMNMLHYAAAYGSEATARKCLDLGVDFRVRDYRGMTALDWAANREHLNIVKALVRAGSDLEEVDGYGWTPLEYLADITPRERRARSWERYSERSAESVLDKSERTLLAHAQDDAVHSIGADAPEKREPCSNVVQYPDERAQKGFVAPSVNSLAPSSFRAALEASDVTEAIRLLEEETQAVTQPLSGFEWLEEPLAMGLTPTEIINLIIEERKEAPWIRYDLSISEQGKFDAGFHRQNCVHGLNLHNAPQDQEQRGPTRETIERTVAEMCGLAGVVPLLTDRSSWDGIATFSEKVARVVYRDTDTTEALVSDINEVKQLARRSLNALGRVAMLVTWLQSNHLICDSFVILRHQANRGYIEAVNIPFRLVAELETHMQSLVDCDSESDTSQSQASVLKISMMLLELFCSFDQEFGIEHLRRTFSHTVDACAVAVQAICIGLLAFSQAHLGELHPFFLMHEVSDVWLCGIGGELSTQMSLSLQLKELSCIGDMLNGPVMVFVHGKQQPTDDRYNLLISLESLFELWGPGQVVVSSHADCYIRGVLVRGGLIYASSHDSTMFHWSQGPPEEVIDFTQQTNISTRDPIIIGGFHVNQDCPFKKAFDKSMSRLDTASQPHVLGTFSEFWSLREVQYGSQAGQYALVAINMTWIKTDARTIESAVINGDWDLDTLEAPWGLLVSVCTGVAQRVPLREVVAEVMPAMVAAMRRRPQEWELLAQNHNIVEKFKDPTFKTWYNSLKRPEKDALDVVTEYILKKIYWTGVDQREKLVVACPSFGDASGCIHMPREQNQALASILKDSEDCATFASVTTKCIETDDQKCRNSHQPKWQDRASLLITSVCQYQQLKTGKRQKLCSPGLQDGKQYWMGYIRDYRRFTAQVQSASGSSIVLKISDSKCPVGWARLAWARLAWERVDRTKSCYIRLVERQLVNEEGAEEVFVLSGE